MKKDFVHFSINQIIPAYFLVFQQYSCFQETNFASAQHRTREHGWLHGTNKHGGDQVVANEDGRQER